MAAYNQWAYRRLFEAVDRLADADYRRDVGLFFGSVHGTLNHLLVGEHLLWYRRFAAGESPRLALNAQVEDDRDRLRERLLLGADAWLGFIDGLAAERFDAELCYSRTNGDAVRLPFGATLLHVFNHATHHRGQITAALTAMAQTCSELDMVIMLQQQAAKGGA